MISDDCDTRYNISLQDEFNHDHHHQVQWHKQVQWATKMALLLEQKEVYGIIKGYDDKPEETAAKATGTEKTAFDDWTNCHGVARSTILQGMGPRMPVEYTVVDDAKTLWENLASVY